MNNKFRNLLLIIIAVIALFLRIWQIGAVPPSPDWDEASLGYNAYSILMTGKDEYGKFLPVVLRSFDDYKPALYSYFIIPFIPIFGLDIISVRLPSVVFGVLAVITMYFFVKELFGKKEIEFAGNPINTEYVALSSSFLLAISPWHLQFSRIGFEACTGFAFNLFSFLFFLKGLKKEKYLVLSFFLGALNIYIYQSEKVFTPLMFVALILIFRNEFMKLSKKYIIISFFTAVLIAFPMILFILTNQGALMRAKGVVSFSDQTEFLKRNSQKIIKDRENKNYLGLLLDNRRIEYAKSIISGYISHFDINWLFTTGDISRHHAPNMGLIYLFELPFILIGIYQAIFGKYNNKAKQVLFAYFLIVPIPASVTSGVPHAVRTINFLATFPIFSALGLMVSIIFINKINGTKLLYKQAIRILYVFVLLFIYNISYFLDQYFVQQNYYNSTDWQYGYKDTISFIKPIMSSYDRIIVSNQAPLDQSYIFFLFYLKYNPSEYQENGGTISGGFREDHKGFLNLTFEPIDLSKNNINEKILYIGRPQDFSENKKLMKTIYYLNGEETIKIFEG